MATSFAPHRARHPGPSDAAHLPDFIIGGPPKCGTSSLFEWLADHPGTQPSEPKEPFFLMDPDHPLRNDRLNVHDAGVDGFGALFAEPSAAAKRFEATTHYLYQRTALEVLAEAPDDRRVVFVLRQPADRVRSSFRYTKHNIGEVAGSVGFDDYVEAVLTGDDAALARWIPNPRHRYVLARDVDYSRYARWLEPWYDALGDERVVVRLFEDLVADPQAFMVELAGALDLEASFYDDYDFSAANQTVRIGLRPVHRLLRRIGPLIPDNPLKSAAKQAYLWAQQKVAGVPASGGDDRRALGRLDALYAEDNARLARLTGLDLSAWRRG